MLHKHTRSHAICTVPRSAMPDNFQLLDDIACAERIPRKLHKQTPRGVFHMQEGFN